MRNKFLHFHRPTIEIEEENEMVRTLRSGWLTKGPKTADFEEKIKQYVGSKYAIGTNSCTSALELALLAIGVKEGDEVITTPMTFPATANAIIHRGAKPVFVDIEEDTFNINPNRLEQAITRKTKAILPVHFAGHPCQMDRILRIAKKNRLFVIEDAAHALGSSYFGKRIGSIGDITCFSFYATKNITTGEGGMVTTNNRIFAQKIRLLSLHGITADAWARSGKREYRHWDTVLPGYKFNMFDIQAALGLVQLKKIGRFFKIRRDYAQIYDDAFRDFPEIVIPAVRKGVGHSFYLYTVLLNIRGLPRVRDAVINKLQKKNIGIGVHYRGLHLHSFYRKTFGLTRKSFPVATYVSDRIFSLPLYPKMTREDLRDVVNAVKDIVIQYRKR